MSECRIRQLNCVSTFSGEHHIDGKIGSNDYGQVFPCTFSSDGKRIAYSVREGEKLFWVIDDVKQKEYSVIGWFKFSPDGKRFAYNAHPDKAWTQRGQRMLMVIDGREEKDYWRVWDHNIFSPDSKKTAYSADPGTSDPPKGVISLDGREISDEKAGLALPVFSPDSKRIAYRATVYQESFMGPWPPPSYAFTVVDGKPGKTYDRASIPVFSPDGRRLAYYGVVQKKYLMIIDNKEGKRYDDIGHPVFSPDSKRVGYYAEQGADRFIVVDGKEYNAYESFTTPIFSPDSKRVCYLAKKSGKLTVVIDDIEGQFYDEIYPRHWRKRVAHNGIGFSSDDSFYYFAKKGSELIFVQETIEP
jgi:Tol biopolymer transport system component